MKQLKLLLGIASVISLGLSTAASAQICYDPSSGYYHCLIRYHAPTVCHSRVIGYYRCDINQHKAAYAPYPYYPYPYYPHTGVFVGMGQGYYTATGWGWGYRNWNMRK